MSRPTSVCPKGHAKPPKQRCRECNRAGAKAFRERQRVEAQSWALDAFGMMVRAERDRAQRQGKPVLQPRNVA